MALNGVNLGGWLLIEKWMTPDLFVGTEATNEFQLAKTASGRARITKHRKEFITEKDLKWLAAHGVELLRVPIGYWAIMETKDYVDARERLDWLVTAAKKHHLKLLLDLHGAPGAQNTKDHSGSGNIPHQKWLRNRTAQNETIKVLSALARRYADQDHIWGIELLNEPASGVFGLRLAWFYRRAYRALTKVARPDTRIVFSDGFQPWFLSGTFGFMRKKAFPVVMDLHLYQCFGGFKHFKTLDAQLRITRRWRQYLRIFGWVQPVMVGEWCAVLPFPTDQDETKQYIAAQQTAYEASRAYCFWSYKIPGGGRWNFRELVETGAYTAHGKINPDD